MKNDLQMAAAEPSKNVRFVWDMTFYHGLKPVDLGGGMKSHEAEQRLPDTICPAPDFQSLLRFGGFLSQESPISARPVPGFAPSAVNLSRGTAVRW